MSWSEQGHDVSKRWRGTAALAAGFGVGATRPRRAPRWFPGRRKPRFFRQTNTARRRARDPLEGHEARTAWTASTAQNGWPRSSPPAGARPASLECLTSAAIQVAKMAASDTGRIRTSFWILQRLRRWALRRVDARMTNSGCSITVSGAGGTREPRIPSAMRAAPSPIRRLC